MPREVLEQLVWIIPIAAIIVIAVTIFIRIKRRGPAPGPPVRGIKIRRKK